MINTWPQARPSIYPIRFRGAQDTCACDLREEFFPPLGEPHRVVPAHAAGFCYINEVQIKNDYSYCY